MDIVWTLGLGAGTVVLFLELNTQSFSAWAALALMLLWSLRMGMHLFFLIGSSVIKKILDTKD